MRGHLSIILLLGMALTITASGQQTSINGSPSPARQEEAKLTPAEEREALDLVARFNERLRATNDFGQIIDEMFVPDFEERLRRASQDSLPLAFLDKSLIGSASPDELRRFYTDWMNFYQLSARLLEAVEWLRKQSDNNEDDLLPEKVLFQEVINTLLRNQITAEWVKEDSDEKREKEESNNSQLTESGDSATAVQAATKADNDGAGEKGEIGIIKSLSQLNDVSATLEKAEELMRQQLAHLPVRTPAVSGDSAEESESNSPKPKLAILDEGQFGCPQGTRAIHLDALPYFLYLIKIDGHLKILFVSPYVD